MPDELVFAVEGDQASAAVPVTFGDAGLREREHLQEWVIRNPEILGPGVLIVTFEFDRWVTGAGQPTYERLDVLGLDQAGRLVVAELKRDRAPDSVTMQALNYAAMVSRFSLDTLAEAFAASSVGDGLTQDDALVRLQEWAPAISDETVGSPRIVLLASEFGPTVTNLALFLYQNDFDISLTRVQPYRTADGRFIVTVSRILPIPDAETFMVKPRSAAQTRTVASTARTEWDWESYETQLNLSQPRIELARHYVAAIERGIRARDLSWTTNFRKGYVAFQRAGGYNVLGVDLIWSQPVRVWVKLPADEEARAAFEDPYPNLTAIWTDRVREYGWHVDGPDALSDLQPLFEVAERFNT
jgi:hypothetical protein